MRYLILVSMLLVGCSEVQHIASSASDISTEAQALIDRGTVSGDKEVVTRAQRINDLATGIHNHLPGVEDRTPAWMTMMTWGAIAIVGVAIVIVLAQTGLGTAVRAVIGWIPIRTQNDARLAASVLNQDKPENIREWIAAKRSDPVWNRAFEDAQKETKKCSATSPSASPS